MKICPTCRRTYPDDGLNFCLEDGTVLTPAGNEPAPTVMYTPAPPTEPSPMVGMRTSWDRKPEYSMQPPPKSSRAWLWIVGVVGLFLLFCGGGLVGIFILAAIGDESNQTNAANTTANLDTNTSGERVSVERVDLSRWVREDKSDVLTAFDGKEFTMATRKKGFYYVLVGKDPKYSTEAARASVTLRNADNMNSSLGYGIVFLSDPRPLQQGYAFLIDSKRRKYRVVRHEPEKELVVVNWTNAPSIKAGTLPNELAVEHNGELIDLYINGTMVTQIRNVHGYQGGTAGLYSGDAAKIAFRDLEVRR
ncbi:MAG TPA: hypothetical protein VK918_06445 [Pyrinomonadaceae bacterium]|nr:hypothetical protein [Pyrinomonadaceae bacterium]